MPKCKYCHENITRFDKEICPFCGSKKPLDGIDDSTYDITQCIDIMNKQGDIDFKQRSHVTNALLCMFLGFFGADAFYLGFNKIAIIRILVNIVLFLGVSLPLFFTTSLTYFSFTIVGGALFLLYFILGIVNFFIKGKKDVNGVFIR